MLWKHYVFRRGTAVNDMWDRFFSGRSLNLLYIGGRGFDPRAQTTIKNFVGSIKSSGAKIDNADLLLIAISRYELDEYLRAATEENARILKSEFSVLGATEELSLDSRAQGEEDVSTGNALRKGVQAILNKIRGRTDIVLK